MANTDYITELDLTPEEKQGVEKYRQWLEARRRASRFASFYAEIDRQYPELDADAREALADSMYRKQQTEFGLKGANPDTVKG